MKESEQRDQELLKTVGDYFDAINEVVTLSSDLEGSKAVEPLDEIVFILSKALLKKHKYIVKASAKWNRRQGLWSRFKEWRETRKEDKEADKEETIEQVKELYKTFQEAKRDENTSHLPAIKGEVVKQENLAYDEQQNELLEF